ncbi:MAG: hypothetical protein Q8R60_11895 [Mycobacteriales bacterium]|nr:hypothetical protein [Mycobacteriales bacterium]
MLLLEHLVDRRDARAGRTGAAERAQPVDQGLPRHAEPRSELGQPLPDAAALGHQGPLGLSSAAVRVDGRLRPKVCVGPATTSSARPAGMVVGADETSTALTPTPRLIPSAIAQAIRSVLPNIDS